MGSLLSRVRLCDPMDCSPPGSSVHGDSPDENTGVGFHALLQGIFLTQGWNPGLPHHGQILYQLSHQQSPIGVGTALITKDGERLAKSSLVTAASVHRRDCKWNLMQSLIALGCKVASSETCVLTVEGRLRMSPL